MRDMTGAVVVVAAVAILPWRPAGATQAQQRGNYCRSAPDTAVVAINMVREVVASTAPRDSAFRAATGIQAAVETGVVLVVDEAKCRQVVDTLNAEAARYGGAGLWDGVYLVSTGEQYAAYAPPGPQESTGLTFMDAQFRILATTVVP